MPSKQVLNTCQKVEAELEQLERQISERGVVLSLWDLKALAKRLEDLEDADVEQGEATLQDLACFDLFDCIKDAYLAVEDRLEFYVQRAW